MCKKAMAAKASTTLKSAKKKGEKKVSPKVILISYACHSYQCCPQAKGVSEAMDESQLKLTSATDTWTTRQMVYTFAYTIGSFINEDWELITYVVDFMPLGDKQHQGIYVGKAFLDGTWERGAFNKICYLRFLFYPS